MVQTYQPYWSKNILDFTIILVVFLIMSIVNDQTQTRLEVKIL